MNVLIFDNTVLSHFARAGQLDTLEQLVRGCRCITTSEVAREIVGGIREHPALAQVLDRDWIEIVELDDVTEIVEFARYKGEFGGGPDRNNGESSVLAWAKVHGGTAVIDEDVATRSARRDGIPVHGTLWLVANGVRDGGLKRDAAERIVDELAATDMRLPVDGASFFAWAYREGLLP